MILVCGGEGRIWEGDFWFFYWAWDERGRGSTEQRKEKQQGGMECWIGGKRETNRHFVVMFFRSCERYLLEP